MDTDLIIDATGNQEKVIDKHMCQYFRKPKVYILSTSTTDKGILIKNGYENKSGTKFIIDESNGMFNMHNDVGGMMMNQCP